MGSNVQTDWDAAARVRAYHERSKHHFHRYARALGYLDWDTQPDPFRRYAGASLLPLEHLPPSGTPLYEPVLLAGGVPPAPLDRRAVSQLFYDSLALSAWKQAGGSRWALRVNPSSGNLHPTEGYLLCGPVPGLSETPGVYHYAPREHALEQRAELPAEAWQDLAAVYPPGTLFVGLTSIHWREAWKYGERAYRYCQHDVGHAVGAVAIAAAGLGWEARLVEALGTGELEALLGVAGQHGPEREHGDCLLALFPAGGGDFPGGLPGSAAAAPGGIAWRGTPNRLSPEHVPWPVLDEAAEAARKPRTGPARRWTPTGPRLPVEDSPVSLRRIVRQRRSAVAMDGRTGITRDAFYQVLRKVLPGPEQVPFTTLPWRPRVHLGLFVHRVQGLDPGLYLLARDADRVPWLRASLGEGFEWRRPEGCPAGMELFRLAAGDARSAAQRLSCHQEIAADGCFSLGMLAEFDEPLREEGAWTYPRLFWECGVVGQVLYLEAEATGIRATGIGCFFDDPVHELFRVKGHALQSLYHFTLGGAVDDPRLTTLPAYPA